MMVSPALVICETCGDGRSLSVLFIYQFDSDVAVTYSPRLESKGALDLCGRNTELSLPRIHTQHSIC